jgi:hypothetical protein
MNVNMFPLFLIKLAPSVHEEPLSRFVRYSQLALPSVSIASACAASRRNICTVSLEYG